MHYQKNTSVNLLFLCIYLINIIVNFNRIIMKCYLGYYLCIGLCSSVYKAICTSYRKLRLFLISLRLYAVINFISNIVLWFSSIYNIVLHSRNYGFPALFSPAPVLRSPASGLQNPGNFSFRPFMDDTETLLDNL